MRTIRLSDGTELGTNEHDGGVFARRQDGTWQQWTGTGQTPCFRSPQQFWRWLQRHYDGLEGCRLQTSRGW
jgi:hypothetical protein